MKIVKHCHEESASNMDIAQGALLGLVVENRLEITNCFPFPKHTDDTMDEEEYQLNMMRRLRRVNVDHFHVGEYYKAVEEVELSATVVTNDCGLVLILSHGGHR